MPTARSAPFVTPSWTAPGWLAPAFVTAAVLAIGGLTWRVRTGITPVDQWVLDWMIAHRGAPLTTAATALTDLGDTGSMAILAVLAVLVFVLRGHPRTAALVGSTALGAAVLVGVIKPLVGRNRPPELTRLVVEPSLSYPSGHTLGSTVVVGIVALTTIPHLRRRWMRWAVAGFAVIFPLAVGLTRVYLGVHWTTDVLAAWLIGLVWLTVCVTVFGRLCRRFPVVPADG